MKSLKDKQAITLLIVEDDTMFRSGLVAFLKKQGYSVLGVSTLQECLEMMDKAQVLLLDVELPDGNGIEFARLLQKEGKAKPLILMSAHFSSKSLPSPEDTGADYVLSKPIDPEALLHCIQALGQRTPTPTC